MEPRWITLIVLGSLLFIVFVCDPKGFIRYIKNEFREGIREFLSLFKRSET